MPLTPPSPPLAPRPVVDHIALKVHALDRAIPTLERLGFEFAGRARHEQVGLDVAFLRLGGVSFELLESIREDSPIAHDADGLHHVAISCDNLSDTLSGLQRSADVSALGPPRPGAHGTPVVFLSLPGVCKLLELVGPAEDAP